MALPLAATLLPSVLKSIYGLGGMLGYNPQRPKYNMPQSVTDAESIYQYLSGADMAGKQEAETNIFQSQANTLDMLQQGVGDSSALLNTAPQVQGQTNQALTQLGIESARQKQAAQGTYANFLQGTKAQYEDKAWQWNEAEPYLNEAKAKEEATKNLFGGIKDIGEGLLDINQAKQIGEMTKIEQSKIDLLKGQLEAEILKGTQKAKQDVINTANDDIYSMATQGVYKPIQTVGDIATDNIKTTINSFESFLPDYIKGVNNENDLYKPIGLEGFIKPETMVNNSDKVNNNYVLTPKTQYGAGNIDLFDRPRVELQNGDIATVYSKSFNIDGKEVLIPTVRKGLNRLMTDKEAIDWYKKTGQFLGKFNTVEEANKYANELHNQQQNIYKL